MKKYTFPNEFLWGAATSGIQTEGNLNQANKSIWDLFYEKEPDNFLLGIGPDKVCETYSKYKEDCQLMKNISLNSIRTSITWSRLIKNFETGEIDEDGYKFYNDYIDEMIKNGINPIINLHHFDMPQELQLKYGGFESKHVVDLFALYCKRAFELFGHKVKRWTTFNEPIVPVEGGYLYNFHYPLKFDMKLGVQVGFNTMLAHSKAIKIYKSMNLDGEIGVILNLTPSYPKSNSAEDLEAAQLADLFFNKSFLDPLIKSEFPSELINILQKYNMLPESTEIEKSTILSNKVDFLGVNYYVPRRVQAIKGNKPAVLTMPEDLFSYYINESGRFNPYRDNNEIWPVSIYDIGKNIKDNYGNIKWYLAEIGIAMDLNSEGQPINGVIEDKFRTDLLKEHLIMLHKSIAEGSNCFGVHMWTFIDCWSWLNSFNRRYGFYRLDLATGERIIKSNALWFKELSENNYFED